MKKQILARLLCISLIAGLLPTTMLAAEIPAQNETNTVEEAGTTVYVGGQEDITQLGHYTTITAALEALSEDTGELTIMLTGDVTETGEVDINIPTDKGITSVLITSELDENPAVKIERRQIGNFTYGGIFANGIPMEIHAGDYNVQGIYGGAFRQSVENTHLIISGTATGDGVMIVGGCDTWFAKNDVKVTRKSYLELTGTLGEFNHIMAGSYAYGVENIDVSIGETELYVHDLTSLTADMLYGGTYCSMGEYVVADIGKVTCRFENATANLDSGFMGGQLPYGTDQGRQVPSSKIGTLDVTFKNVNMPTDIITTYGCYESNADIDYVNFYIKDSTIGQIYMGFYQGTFKPNHKEINIIIDNSMLAENGSMITPASIMYQGGYAGDEENRMTFTADRATVTLLNTVDFDTILFSGYSSPEDRKVTPVQNIKNAVYTISAATDFFVGDDQPESATINVVSPEGYRVTSCKVNDEEKMDASGSITLTGLKEGDHIVTTMEPIFFTVSYDLDGGTGGEAYQPEMVRHGNTVTVKAVPEKSGYTFTGWSDGTTVYQPGDTITVEQDITLTAQWKKNGGSGGDGGTTRYTIKAEAQKGGFIFPSGRVRVDRGDDQTFRITADEGYEIEDVLVDGYSVGTVERYTFENVRSSHTIEAVFEAERQTAHPDETGVSGWLNTKDHFAYLTGYDTGTFGPNKNMTRAEVAQMFYNLLRNKEVPITVSFTDVAPDTWYARAVNTLGSLGIITGVGNNQFEPDRAITRAEFTSIAMRFAKLDTSGENIFSDVSADNWFYGQVVGSIKYGWITGYEDGTFRPLNTITRAEATTIVNQMLGRAADADYVDAHMDKLRQFPDVLDSDWAYYQIMEATNDHGYTKSGSVEDWTELTQ